MSVPKHRRAEHNYQYIANAREIRKIMFVVIRRLDKSDDIVEEFFKRKLLEYCAQLTQNIRIAHDIYIKTYIDFAERRKYQSKAIAMTNLIMEEITNLIELFPKYIKTFENVLKLLNNEVALLRGWRKSTDKVADNLKLEYVLDYAI